MKLFHVFALVLLPAASVAYAGEADVIDAKVKQIGDNMYEFAVTLRHDDKGWDHYADKWDVVAPDGKILGTRILRHPHVEEQPFTRSLSGVKIPKGVDAVTIRGHDSVHKYGGKTVTADVPRKK
jgi:hypothetical protein